MRALLSVADEAGVVELARALLDLGVELVADAETTARLEVAGVSVRPLEAPQGATDLLGGRVTSFDPALYASILARRDQPEAMGALEAHGLAAFDLVVVAHRPFVQREGSRVAALDEAVESIDVAALSLLAAGARNLGGVAVLCDPADYAPVVAELRDRGNVSAETRRRLAARAFARLAEEYGQVADYLERLGGVRFPDRLSLVLHKVRDLPYGENPHQEAAFYRQAGPLRPVLADAGQLQGPSPTFNDLVDLDAGQRMAADFALPTCVIVKQRNPVGLASHDDLLEGYRRALSGDPVTAYGAVLAFNRLVDEVVARELLLNPFEGVVAPGFSPGALAVLAEHPGLAVLAVPPPGEEGYGGLAGLDFQRLEGGLLVESRDTLEIDHGQLHVVTRRRPTLEELTDLMFAWRAVRHVTSLAVVVAKGAMLVGIGAGQSSRLTATEIALHRAAERAPRSVLASDAYFPFVDAIALAAERGVTAIIQPGGSVRDEMAIEVADRHHLAMVFTGRRHYRH